MHKVFTLFLIFLVPSSCVFKSYKTKLIATQAIEKDIRHPVNVHLNNGGVVHFREGFRVSTETGQTILLGQGTKSDIHRTETVAVDRVLLDEVYAVEVIDKEIDYGAMIYSIPAVYIMSLPAYVIIFGSCPTYYVAGPDSLELKAEGFSYAVSPGSAYSDLDLLETKEDYGGSYSFVVKNEALETHYIDQLHLVYVDHPPSHRVIPTYRDFRKRRPDPSVLMVGPPVEDYQLRDRSGRDMKQILKDEDEVIYRTPEDILNNSMNNEAERDWLEINFEVPVGKDEVFLSFKGRNTLMNTVLLYEVLMDEKDFGAIDWLADDMNDPFYQLKFYNWFKKMGGVDLILEQNGRKREVGKIFDQGPITWSTLAYRIAVEPGIATLRLSFLPDNWMIDMVNISYDGRSVPFDIAKSDPSNDSANQLENVDQRYLITQPGYQSTFSFTLKPKSNPAYQRTYMVNSTGFYTEWIRGEWLRSKSTGIPNDPDSRMTRQMVTKWIENKEKFEILFFDTMYPTQVK